ncbi:MAG: hypothetical protein V2B20_10695 [Pseudomonadota bacterium]
MKKKEFEPDWLDPANDRKTPYTEEELDLFVSGFIGSNKSKWKALVSEFGKEKAWNLIKEGFRKMDERSVSNMEVDNSTIH